ncbi:MAG: helix-turn-helix domain-containing protein, partial [Bacteroidota bacterium]
HLLDINGPAHIFFEAKSFGAAINLHFVALLAEPEVESSAGLCFAHLEAFSHFELGPQDFVFIPGLDFQLLINSDFLRQCSPFFDWLDQQYRNGAKLCSVCTGAFLLAEAGILDGRTCTTHWKYFSIFRQRYPRVHLEEHRLFVVAEQLYSSAGVSSGIDLALYLLEKQFDTQLAVKVAQEVLIYFRRGSADPQLSIFLEYRNHLDQRIHRAQDFIVQHLSAGFTLTEIAKSAMMSSRNLSRCFKKMMGITIGTYVEKLRMERAVQLLKQGHKVQYVAQQCGLKSSNQLRSLFQKHQGILPSDLFE